MKKFLIFQSIVVSLLATMLFSCRNDLKTIESLANKDTIPDLIVKDVTLFRSDSGIIKAKLISEEVQHFNMGDDPYILFPKGLFVIIYDRDMNEESTIVAGYGKSYEKRKLLVVEKDVVVKNLIKQEQLNTEQLFWDQRNKTIYSNVNVKITTLSEILYGTGLHSDERFDRYEITNPTGEVEVEEEEL